VKTRQNEVKKEGILPKIRYDHAMSEVFSLFIVLTLAFLFFTQLSLLTSLRLIQRGVLAVHKDLEDQKNRRIVSQFEQHSSKEAA